MSNIRTSLFLALGLVATAHGSAHAYLDPGTGSYMLQIIAGVVLGAAVAVKAFWFRIRLFFLRISKKGRQDQ